MESDPRTGREPARDGPPPHPRQDQEAEGAGRAGPAAARHDGPRPRPPAVPTVAIVGNTNAGKSSMLNTLVGARRRWRRTDSSPRSIRPAARSSSATDSRPSDRHRRLHPQAAPPARRCLPRDTRGGHPSRVLLEVVDAADSHAPSTGDGPEGPRRAGRGRGPDWSSTTRPTCSSDGTALTRHRSWPAPCSSRRSTGFGLDTLRAAGGAARVTLGGGRRRRCHTRGRAAGARPGAGHGRDRLRRARRPCRGCHPCTRQRAPRGRGTLGRVALRGTRPPRTPRILARAEWGREPSRCVPRSTDFLALPGNPLRGCSGPA